MRRIIPAACTLVFVAVASVSPSVSRELAEPVELHGQGSDDAGGRDMLPPQLKGDAVLALLQVELMGTEADALAGALSGLLGSLPEGEGGALRDRLDSLLDVKKELADSGARRATYVLPGPDVTGREPEPCVLIEPADPEGRSHLKRALERMLGPDPAYGIVDMPQPEGAVLLLPEQRTPLLSPGDAERQHRFEAALAAAEGQVLRLIVVGSPTLQRQVGGHLENVELPSDRRAFGQLLLGLVGARYIVAWLHLKVEDEGSKPEGDEGELKLQVLIQSEDRESAAAMVTRIATLGRRDEGGQSASRWGRGATQQTESESKDATSPSDPLLPLRALIGAAKVEVDGERILLTIPAAAMRQALRSYARESRIPHPE